MMVGVSALMDLSDGLSSDISRMARASRCQIRVDLDRIPISQALQRICSEREWDALSLAWGGGEDYSLLMTVDPFALEALRLELIKRFSLPFTAIGKVLPLESGAPSTESVLTYQRGTLEPTPAGLFRHF